MIIIKPKFFVKFFLFIAILILILLSCLNYIVNPLGKYSSNYFKPLIRTSRSEKTTLLNKIEYKPEIIILGSSRSMKLDPNYIEKRIGVKAFNASVNSAKAEDYYAMLMYILNKTDIKPKAVFVGIDIEAFHNHLPPDERLLNHQSLSNYLNGNNLNNHHIYADLISLDQTKYSLKSISFALKGYPEKTSSFDYDGFLHYLIREKEKKEGTFQLEKHIKNSIDDYLGRFKGYSDTDKERLDYFQKFLHLSQQNDIRVIGFITTLHDEVLRELINKRNYNILKINLLTNLLEFESAFTNFKFVDFDNVNAYNGSLTDFYDGGHIAEENSNKIAEELIKLYKSDIK